MLNEKQNIQWKHYSNALKLFTIQPKIIIRFGLRIFIRKFVAATKNLKTNYTFFVKPTCLLLIKETRNQWQIFDFEKVHFHFNNKNWYSVNLFCCETYIRGVFRTQSDVYNKACLYFSQRSSTEDVLWVLNTPYIHIHIGLSRRNHMHIEFFL